MALSETLTMMLLDAKVNGDWKYDHNTTMLLVLESNLASMLKAMLMVSNDLKNIDNIDPIGLINGLTETLEWLTDNMERIEKHG